MKPVNLKRARWLYPLLGAAAGVLYTLLDEGVMDQTPGLPGWSIVVHEFLDFILPVLLGASVGIGAYFIRRERRLSRRLSLKNDRMRQDLLFNTLISQMLHEIQNPLHNLSAALEESGAVLPQAQRELVDRNLKRLSELKTLYGRWGSALEHLDPEEPTDFSPFFERLLEEKVGSQLSELGAQISTEFEPVAVFVHAAILEQALLGLLSNALFALEDSPPPRALSVSARLAAGSDSIVEIRISNKGAFPAEVLDSQGRRPLPSDKGLGLGLLLTRTLLEQVGGDLRLSNESDRATAVLCLRGKKK